MILRTSFCSCQLSLDPLEPFLTNAVDMQQEIGSRLKYLQRPLLVDADDLSANSGTDAADCPGGKILFDAFG